MGSCYCVESSVVGCLLCHAGCSTDKLASSLAFHPPSPPSYALTTAPDGRRRAVFDPANEEYSRLARDWGAALAQCEVDEVRTRRGNTVCVLRLRRGSADDAYVGRVTLIVSHGNALDAALFVPFASHVAHQLDANVSVYDYSGYGRSSGVARVEDCKADIEAVVRHHVERLGCDPARIVLYGQSIGSGPTCHYAALAGRASRGYREGNNPTSVDGERADPRKRLDATPTAAAYDVGGVVLVSPIMSGLSVISPPEGGSGGARCTPACVYRSCDVFKNFDAVGSFKCPTLVVHGRLDDQVPCSHGIGLHALLVDGGCEGGARPGGGGNIANGSGDGTGTSGGDATKAWKHPDPYWVKNAGHQNVYDADPPQFLSRMRAFVADVNARAGGGGSVGAALVGPMTETDIDPGPPVGEVRRRDGGAPIAERARDAPAGFAPQIMTRG